MANNDTTGAGASAAGRELVFTRLLAAPRERVFDAWTKPEQIAQWWGADGFTSTIQQIDMRSGGTWLFVMHGPNGINYDNRIVFIEVEKPGHLVYRHDAGNEDDPDQFLVTITLEEAPGNTTRLTMQSLFRSAEARDKVVKEQGAVEGANQTLNHLEAYLVQYN